MHPVERCARACAGPAWRLAYAMLRDADEAYDAVQQAFLAAARKPDAVPAGDPWPGLAVVVANEARNLRRKRRPVPCGVGAATGAEATAVDVPDPRATDPARAAGEADEARRLWAALEALPGPEREAVLLTHVAGLTHAEAAEAIAAPRQTVTDRAARGVEALSKRLRRGAPATASALAALPIEAPRQGLGAATTEWVDAAMSGTTTGSVVSGGTVVASAKAAWVAGIVVAAGLAFVGGGATGAFGLFPDEGKGAGSRGVTAPPAAAGGMNDAGPAGVDAGMASLAARPADDPDAPARLREENARLSARVADLEKALASQAGMADAKPGSKSPLFTFGEMGRLEAVREADWPMLSAAAKVVGDAVAEMHRKTKAGEQVPEDLYLRLQENVERVRTYEYRTFKKMPTAAQHNGELTHPISASNLLAGILAQAGKPLSAAQVAEVERLGVQFDADFARVRAAWTADVPRARRLLEEMRLKGRFMDALWALLTDEQRPLWVDPAFRGLASVDLF